MPNKKRDFYGILFVVIILIVSLGLFASNQPTGFAVRADKCFEGTAFGECSFVKPKYCDNGALKPNCQKCGCNKNEVCQDDGTCLQKCADTTLFGHCSENKPLLCFKGSLLENCFECGCFPGQTCLQNGTCAGTVEAVEEKKEVEEKIEVVEEKKIEEDKEEEKIVEEEQKLETKEPKKAGFWWNFFCKVFYFNEYDDCIADAIRYQNK